MSNRPQTTVRIQPPASHQLKALPFALITAAGLSLGLVGTVAQAATIVVNNGGDAASSSVCILRDAMRFMQTGSISGATNNCTNTGGAFGTADTITFGNAITTISLTQGAALVYGVNNSTQSLLIQGSGQGGITITRPTNNGGLIRHYGGDLTLDGITLTGGRTASGGAVQVDLNGIKPATKLQLKNSVITGNSASGAGAGIYTPLGANAVATITITNSTISNNQAYGGTINGAGIYLGGASTLTMTGSTLSNNGTSGGTNVGGAIYAFSPSASAASTVNITDSTLSGNAASSGGGIYLVGPSALNITGSTLSGNTASSDGGGIYVSSTGSTLAVANSTLSSNSAFCNGAGLFIASGNANTFPAVSFTSSTVTLNSTSGECPNGAGVTHYGGSLTLNNTIMAGNTRGSSPADIARYFGSAVTVLGSNNLVQNVSSGVTFTNAPLTSDPQLGLLQNNGGPTLTHALLSGSPAINAGSSTSSLTTDQRGAGFQRVVGTAVDIGAFEVAIDGACGAASSATPVLAKPTANLCSTGTATTVAGPQPFTWGCNGIGGGSTSTSATACSVPIQQWTVSPLVSTGPASGSLSPSTAQTVNQNALTSFTVTPASGYTLGSVTGCNGTLSGSSYTTGAATADCNVVASFHLTPINGTCGGANGRSVDSAPTANLCSTGTATAVNSNGSIYSWTCGPNATGIAGGTCFAPINQYTATSSVIGGNGAFDSPSKRASYNTATSFVITPSAGFSIGSVGGSCGGSLSGNTYTTAPMSANCAVTATFTLVPVNGACGAASSSTPVLSAPMSNLCSSGTATAVSGTGPWTWGCNGNGANASTSTTVTACSVPIKTWAVTPSVSGGNGIISPSTIVTVNNNAATSFTVTPSSGYNISSVVGCSGTRSGSTFNIAAVTADCAVVAMFSAVPRAAIALSGNAVPIANGATTPLITDGTDFGSLVIGQSLLHNFTISNSGSTTLTITGLSFTGANAADFTVTSPTVFPVTVNASASTTISVRFTPRATGPRSASLLIAYDDGAPSGSASEARLKAAGNTGFAVQGIGVAAAEVLPVPAWGLGGLMASLLGLLLAGIAGLRHGGKR